MPPVLYSSTKCDKLAWRGPSETLPCSAAGADPVNIDHDAVNVFWRRSSATEHGEQPGHAHMTDAVEQQQESVYIMPASQGALQLQPLSTPDIYDMTEF